MGGIKQKLEEVAKGRLPKLSFPPGPPMLWGHQNPKGWIQPPQLSGGESLSSGGKTKGQARVGPPRGTAILTACLSPHSASLPVAANVASAGAWTSTA